MAERYGDGVLVVLHEEDDGQVEDGGEVQCLVEVTFAGGAVTAHGHHYRVFTAQLGGMGNAHGVQQLGGQRGALDADVVLFGVVSTVPVAAEDGHHLYGVYPAGHDGDGVAVGGEQPVTFAEAHGSCHLAGFLAVA
ncbi:hypothetical protein PJL18_00362 [Paenarthrobacter nicotinovorans]|nr:hypothetical protein [Paenarthrobacter nicotinovorans]